MLVESLPNRTGNVIKGSCNQIWVKKWQQPGHECILDGNWTKSVYSISCIVYIYLVLFLHCCVCCLLQLLPSAPSQSWWFPELLPAVSRLSPSGGRHPPTGCSGTACPPPGDESHASGPQTPPTRDKRYWQIKHFWYSLLELKPIHVMTHCN